MAELNINEMLQIKRDKLTQLKNEGKNPHLIEKVDVDTKAIDIVSNFEEFDGKEVKVAGRILGKRSFGKIGFIVLQDDSSKIQIFNRHDTLGEEKYQELKNLDTGDIATFSGEVIKTQTGEISVLTKEFQLLTKSLQILPEKFHGLKDVDLRYRQRYVDLIVNPEVKDVFRKRTKILSAIREFLDNRDFLEVETPILNTIAGGATARPFVTHHNTLDIDMYLRIANELYLKRLIVGGFDKVYEMGRMFRNEGMDATHNPEYTAIELYEAYADYNDMMELTENLVLSVNQKVNGSNTVDYQGTEIDFTTPWKRITMVDAIKEETGIDFNNITDFDEAKKLAQEHKLEIKETDKLGNIIVAFFEEYVEDKLIQPTFVTQYPVEISPLTKRNPENPSMTQRFEAFIYGKEIANAYSELNDAEDQRERFEDQMRLREAGDEEANLIDYDFINAIEVGMAPTGGMGMGIDRLVMFLTNQTTIRDVLLFPTMKPLGNEVVKEKEVKVTDENDEVIDFSKVTVEPLFEDMIDFETFSKSDLRVVKVINCEEVPKSKKLLKFTLNDGSDKERIILSGIKNYYSAEELIGKTLVAITNLPPRKMMGIESEGMIISAIHEEEGEEKLNLLMLSNRIPAGAKLY
ncbi:lysine--tRNA ligase [Helcococcus kunzii]|uniref:lysine--tRNA ligase n=1 Tax=Helcococcus kunzii TaxID=40091 RepID=UPI001BB04FCC|nr:lysine--tRNA ligase [Helcococcus kunzii]QUY64752.1 lysine--tRNA ligase [Helcococcus kunzii]